jgi:hypothetical protein
MQRRPRYASITCSGRALRGPGVQRRGATGDSRCPTSPRAAPAPAALPRFARSTQCYGDASGTAAAPAPPAARCCERAPAGGRCRHGGQVRTPGGRCNSRAGRQRCRQVRNGRRPLHLRVVVHGGAARVAAQGNPRQVRPRRARALWPGPHAEVESGALAGRAAAAGMALPRRALGGRGRRRLHHRRRRQPLPVTGAARDFSQPGVQVLRPQPCLRLRHQPRHRRAHLRLLQALPHGAPPLPGRGRHRRGRAHLRRCVRERGKEGREGVRSAMATGRLSGGGVVAHAPSF